MSSNPALATTLVFSAYSGYLQEWIAEAYDERPNSQRAVAAHFCVASERQAVSRLTTLTRLPRTLGEAALHVIACLVHERMA